MGTRSITIVLDEDNNKIIEMYKQFDGYPDGLGLELQQFISSGKMVNGIGLDRGKVFNGINCFAAQLVSHMKTEAGGIYLHAPTTLGSNYGDIYGVAYYYIIDSDLKLTGYSSYSNDIVFVDGQIIEEEEEE